MKKENLMCELNSEFSILLLFFYYDYGFLLYKRRFSFSNSWNKNMLWMEIDI